jgi:hypothetical protein
VKNGVGKDSETVTAWFLMGLPSMLVTRNSICIKQRNNKAKAKPLAASGQFVERESESGCFTTTI